MDAESDAPDGGDVRLHEVLGAYLEFADAGCAPDPEDFVAHYPELADGLREFFVVQERVSAIAGTPAPARIDEQQTLGDYQLDRKIGGGSEGDVFRAWHKGLRKWVALKWIKAGAWASPAEVRRFRVGIEAAARLDHRHIAPVYDVREHRGVPYFSMKLYEAGSVEKHLDKLESDLRASATLIAKVARAIHFAHQHGILHLDLKPGNILLDEDGEPYVADFGLARRIDVGRAIDGRAIPPPPRPMPDAATSRSTVGSRPANIEDSHSTQDYDEGKGASEMPGHNRKTVTLPVAHQDPTVEVFRGTVGYAPVEPPSTAADIHGLGATLYRFLTGRKTFENKGVVEYALWFRANDPEPPRKVNPKVDARLEAICLKCLRKNPADRYASAEALADDLDRWLRGEPPLAWEMPWRLRAWRAMRTYLLTIVLTSTAVFTGAAAFFALYYFDPERIPRALEAESRRGHLVLVGEAGPPRWSRWNLGEGTVMARLAANDPLSITTLEKARLELLRKPPGPRYRFAAEVRHDTALNNGGRVGIYFGHTARETDGELKRYWSDITFAEIGADSLAEPGPNPKIKYSAIELTLQRHAVPNSFGIRDTKTRKPFVRSENLGWRRLAVNVTPEKVQVFWEDDPLPELSVNELRKLEKSLIVGGKVLTPEFEFEPDGALGLYVFQGKASFRRVTIEPLP